MIIRKSAVGLTNRKIVKGTCLASIVVFLYYFFGLHVGIDFEYFPTIGFVYHLLSIPMLIIVGFVPIAALFQMLNRNKLFPFFPLISLMFFLFTLAIISYY